MKVDDAFNGLPAVKTTRGKLKRTRQIRVHDEIATSHRLIAPRRGRKHGHDTSAAVNRVNARHAFIISAVLRSAPNELSRYYGSRPAFGLCSPSVYDWGSGTVDERGPPRFPKGAVNRQMKPAGS